MISIPRKTSGIVNNLYFVSTKDELDKKIIHPEIPSDFLTRGKFSDWQTPRIRLYTSISDALSGNWLGENLKDSELYVYRAKGIRNESLIKPSITSVPYALVLDEWWYLQNLGLDYLGKIKVISEAGKEIYHYGPRSTKAFVYKWKWEEIGLKSWEKSKLINKSPSSVPKRRKLFSDNEEITKKITGSVLSKNRYYC
jgi:hypothetical protein